MGRTERTTSKLNRAGRRAARDLWRNLEMRAFLACTCAAATAAAALAVTPTIDGKNITAGNWGGAAVAVQDTNTGFGNGENELNQMFITSDSSNIYIGIPGNIADNNGLTLWIDTDAGAGSTTIASEPGGGCPGNIATLVRMFNGTQFDTGFTPDYNLLVSVGKFPGQSDQLLVFAANLTTLSPLSDNNLGLGAIVDPTNGTLTGSSGVRIAIDNSNTAGVGNWGAGVETPAQSGDDPTTATTGIEISIPRSLLGLTGATPTNVRFCAYISNNGQDGGPGPCNRQAYGSNQSLPGLAGAGNLASFNGNTLSLNFAAATGTQWVQVTIPAP